MKGIKVATKKVTINFEHVIIIHHDSIEDVDCKGWLVGNLSTPKCNGCNKHFDLDED